MYAPCQLTYRYYFILGYARRTYVELKEFFRYLVEQEVLEKSPMNSVPMMKKANFFAAQGKEDIPTAESITVFTPEEIEKFKEKCFRTWSNGARIYQQVGAYILMLNTGLHSGEMLGVLNSDVDPKKKVIHIRQGVKEIRRRAGVQSTSGKEIKIGKLK